MEGFGPSGLPLSEIQNVNIPEIDILKGVIENNFWHHNQDVYSHTMSVYEHLVKNLAIFSNLRPYFETTIAELSREQVLGWATLFHDIAKPETIIEENGRTRSPTHSKKGAEKAKQIMERFDFDSLEITRVSRLVEFHMRPHSLLDIRKPHNQIVIDVEDFFREFPDISIDLLLLGLSDVEGSNASEADPAGFPQIIQLYHDILSNVNIEEFRAL